jgi:hypothetical protein
MTNPSILKQQMIGVIVCVKHETNNEQEERRTKSFASLCCISFLTFICHSNPLIRSLASSHLTVLVPVTHTSRQRACVTRASHMNYVTDSTVFFSPIFVDPGLCFRFPRSSRPRPRSLLIPPSPLINRRLVFNPHLVHSTKQIPGF